MTNHLKRKITKWILDEVELKRRLSVKEFTRSDLYEMEDIDEVNKWYTQLKNIIEENPPLSYPNCVEIVEKGGNIVRIEYLYSEKKDDFTEISFSIQIDE